MKTENTQLIELIQRQREAFGAWLREQREERELSKPDFAAQIGLTGRARLSEIENGEALVTRDRAIRIAAALDLPAREVLQRAGYFLGDDELPPELQRFNELDDHFKKLVVGQIKTFYRAQREQAASQD